MTDRAKLAVQISVAETAVVHPTDIRAGLRLASGSAYAELRPSQRKLTRQLLDIADPIVVCAQTGTGKTILMLTTCFVATAAKATIALFIAPTRGLVVSLQQKLAQASAEGRAFFFCSDLEPVAELEKLRAKLLGSASGVVIVSTPDQMTMASGLPRFITTSDVRIFVCDEAHLLESHATFREAVRLIPSFYASLSDKYGNSPALRFLSGTLTASRANAAADLVYSQRMSTMKRPSLVILQLQASRCRCATFHIEERRDIMGSNSNGREERRARARILARRLPVNSPNAACKQSIIFVNTKVEAGEFSQEMSHALKDISHKARVVVVTSETKESTRKQIVSTMFVPTSELLVVVSTELLGIGIDSVYCGFVAHAEIPTSMERYAQEIGRLNHGGILSGCSYTLITAIQFEEEKLLERVRKYSPLLQAPKPLPNQDLVLPLTLMAPIEGESHGSLLLGPSGYNHMCALYETLVYVCRRVKRQNHATSGVVGTTNITGSEGLYLHNATKALAKALGIVNGNVNFSDKAEGVQLAMSLAERFPASITIRPCSVDVAVDSQMMVSITKNNASKENAEMHVFDQIIDTSWEEQKQGDYSEDRSANLILAAQIVAKKVTASKLKQKLEDATATADGKSRGTPAKLFVRVYAHEIAHELSNDQRLECSDLEAMRYSEWVLSGLLPPRHSTEYSSSKSLRREWRVSPPRWLLESPRSTPVFDAKINAKALAKSLAISSIAEMSRRELSITNDINKIGRFARNWTDGSCPIHMLASTFGGEARKDLARCRPKDFVCKFS